MRIWFDVITHKDAVLLKQWWDTHTIKYHHIRRSTTNPRFWALYRD